MADALTPLVARRFPRHRRLEILIVGLAVALLLADYLHIGLRTEFIPCVLDCGETYEGYIGALNLHRFGLTHAGGLQDFAASARPVAHPTVYTHNPNLGMYFMYGLMQLGFVDIHAQAPWRAVPFGLGLAYMYAVIRGVSGSGILAGLCLLNAATMYLLVAMWGFHGLRVFSWLLTFGPVFHLRRYIPGARHARWHLALGLTYVALSLGIDYPFAVFGALNLLALRATGLLALQWRRLVVILAVGLGIPFLLRQAQVALVLGPGFWAADLLYSVLRRVPLAGGLAHVPDEEALAALYASHHVLKWPGTSPTQPLVWIRTLVDVYREVLGTPFLWLVAGWICLLALIAVAGPRTLVRRGGRPLVATGGLVASLMGAQAVTFTVFGGYFASFYGSSLMPLMVHWIVPVLGATMFIAATLRAPAFRLGRAKVSAGILALALFIAWRAGTEVVVRRELRPAGYPGREVLADLRGRSVVTFWVSSAVSAYTHDWVARLHDPRWRVITPADLPFDPPRDYYFFFEADRGDPRYRTPDFLFVPGINAAFVMDRRCNPLRGLVGLPMDGCVTLDGVARRMAQLPLYRRGPDYLVYDLRPVYAARRREEPASPAAHPMP